MNDQEFERLAAKVLVNSAEVVDLYLFENEYKRRIAPSPFFETQTIPMPEVCYKAAHKLAQERSHT